MPEEFKYALIGGGLASASAAAGIREHDAEGSIAIISAEKYYPYHRPPSRRAIWSKATGSHRMSITRMRIGIRSRT